MRARLIWSCGVVSALTLAAAFEGCGSNDQTTPADGGGSLADTTTSAGDATSPDDGGSTGVGQEGGNPSSRGSSSGDSSAAGLDGAPASDGGVHTPDAATVPYDPSVYQHHKNGTRDGVYIDLVFNKTAAATTHVLTSFIGTVSSSVYAQPLYVQNGPGGKEAFIVATETNHVTAYDATTGATLWDKGPAVYGTEAIKDADSGPPCSPLNPLGITGTPFIDYSSGQGVIYFDAMVTPDGNRTFKHLVYAVKVEDGTVLPNWPVDVSAKVAGFNAPYQNQRGALQFVKGVLYVPYGGQDGDCGSYFGWVIGFPVANPQSPTGWHTSGAKGGIWGPGALPTDGTSVFPVTGNTAVPGTMWGGGEAVIRLGAGPAFSGNFVGDYYAPTNWKYLDDHDQDLGGASEVLFDMPGAFRPHLARGWRQGLGTSTSSIATTWAASTTACSGKTELHSAARRNLGGQGSARRLHDQPGDLRRLPHRRRDGGRLPQQPDAERQPRRREDHVGSHRLYGEGCLVLRRVRPWLSDGDDISSRCQSALVWAANNRLYAYDGDTGAKIVDGTKTAMSSSVQGWNTPIEAKGRIAVGVNGQLYVFTP